MTMRHSLKTGLSFGLTSAIVTTLGLMVGLHSGTHSKSVVVGGILLIAVADAFSDALGIHVAEESENRHTAAEVWQSTLTTFATKFVFALTFVVPVLALPLSKAIVVSILWGLSLLVVFSYYIAVQQKAKVHKVVLEHVLVASVVIAITHWVGDVVRSVVN